MPYFADNPPFMLYNYDYWITGEDFTLNDINISGAVNVDTNERDGWGENQQDRKSSGCLATKPPCNGSPTSFWFPGKSSVKFPGVASCRIHVFFTLCSVWQRGHSTVAAL